MAETVDVRLHDGPCNQEWHDSQCSLCVRESIRRQSPFYHAAPAPSGSATPTDETRKVGDPCPECGRGIGVWFAPDESPCACAPSRSGRPAGTPSADNFDAAFIVRALSPDARYDADPAVYEAYCRIGERYEALKSEGRDFATSALMARSEWLTDRLRTALAASREDREKDAAYIAELEAANAIFQSTILRQRKLISDLTLELDEWNQANMDEEETEQLQDPAT